MFPRVVRASYVGGYVVRVCFADGTEGDVNLEAELQGEIFEPLREMAVFRNFRVDPDVHTLTWPNGADFAPEFLYGLVKVAAA